MEDSFNYVAVLVSIVIGLGMTKVLSQLSEAIQAQDRKRNYWVHTLWMVNLFHLPDARVVGLLSMERRAVVEFLSLHLGDHRADAALSRLRRALSR